MLWRLSIILFLTLLTPRQAAVKTVADFENNYDKETYLVMEIGNKKMPEFRDYIKLYNKELYKVLGENGLVNLSSYKWVIRNNNLYVLPVFNDSKEKFLIKRGLRDNFIKELNKEIDSWGDREKLTTLEKLENINRYLYNNYVYDWEVYRKGTVSSKTNVSKSGFHKARTWTGVYEDKSGVCSGFTKIFEEIAKLYDIENVITVQNQNHAWNAVKIDGEWKYFDSTWNTVMKNEKAYFNLSYEEMLLRDKELSQDLKSHILETLLK